MAKLLSGKDVAAKIQENLVQRTQYLKERGAAPCLAIVRVGEKDADLSYEKGAGARCRKTGIFLKTIALPGTVSQTEMLGVMDNLNEDPSVHGVLLLRPLPEGLDEYEIVNRLCPEKDVDGMTDLSMSSLLSGGKRGYAPCTAEAAMEFFDYYGIELTGRRAVVIGRSTVFGKPAALMLLRRNATVTICHTKTRDLPSVARQAEVLLVAAGHPGMCGADCIAPGQIVIDVGINMGPDHKLCGDVVFEEAEKTAGAITPVPGGVGAVTTAILLRHVVEACERTFQTIV